MTTAPAVEIRPSTVAVDGAPQRTEAELTRELFTELGRLGARVAELDPGDAAAWHAARPALSRLSVDMRRLTGDLAAGGAPWPDDVAGPLRAADPVPPVVWAREVAAVHRLLRRALAHSGADGGQRGQRGRRAALTRMLHTTTAVLAELTAGPVGRRLPSDGPLAAPPSMGDTEDPTTGRGTP